MTKTEQKSCVSAKSEVEGANLILGVLGIIGLSTLYYTSEQRYPGTGFQSLIYGGAITGSVYLVSQIPMHFYTWQYCNLDYQKKSSR